MNIQNFIPSGNISNRSSCWWYLLVLIYAIYAHLFFGNYDAYIALHGFSALDFSNSVLYSENFVRDYPGGAWGAGRSLLPWVYPALQSVGVLAEKTLVLFIMLEMVTLSAGAIYLMKTLFNKIPSSAIVMLTTLFLLSWVRFPNLARFGNPYFHGQFYGFADGLGLIAIALYLRSKYLFSAILLIVAFTIHPIKASFALTFIFGMHLWHWKTVFSIQKIVPYLLFIAFAVLWVWFWLGMQNTDNVITHEEFFRYAGLFNSHWFPEDLGILNWNHWQYTTPFMSAALMFFAVITRSNLNEERKGQLVLGMLVVGVLATVGIIVALMEFSPTLVKASFQRSTVLMLSMASIMVCAQTIVDIKAGRWWYGVLGNGILGVAFFERSTWPIILTIVYSLSVLTSQEGRVNQPFLIVALLPVTLFGIISYEVNLYYYGYQNSAQWLQQFKWSGLVILVAIAGSTALHFFSRTKCIVRIQRVILVLIIVGFTYGAYHWGMKYRTLSPEKIEQGLAYKSVQLWAHENTKISSVFMVDPCQPYGWRDYSARSSFGSIHEWYKTGWLYSGNQVALHEGIKRGASLGIDVGMPPPKFCGVARSVFYHPDGKKLANITINYDIQYVVMDKLQAKYSGGIPDWSKAYENKNYVVLIPPHEQKG